MGCGTSSAASQIQYSVEVSSPLEGESGVRRHPKGIETLYMYPDPETRTLQHTFKNTVKLYGTRPFLGTQKNDVYNFITYNETYALAQQIGSGIINLGLAPPVSEYLNFTLKLVGAFSKNRTEWIILDLANVLYGNTMCPFYDTLGADSIPFILQQTNLTTIFLSSVKAILQIPKESQGRLKNLVLFDEIEKADYENLQKLGFKLFTWQEILENGKQKPQPEVDYPPQSIFTFSYTSGTTGNPKGAMVSHRNLVSTVATLPYGSINIGPNDVYLSYLPLPHVMERLSYLLLLSAGGSMGFYRGDQLLLKEDISRLRPTYFVSVPRLFNKFYDGIKAKIDAVQGTKRSFADRAVTVKLENLRSSAEYKHFLYDKAFQAVRELFGGRVRYMITGSAPLSRDVIDFLKIAVSCPILEGYGQTESCGASFLTVSNDPISGHVGGPNVHTEFKLVDVPDMNYTSKDLDLQGKSIPRGEVCIRSPSVFPGYYKDLEKTNEAIDQDGWLHTGDVGMILPGGNIKIIDRKKNIFKLSQGEYIAPEKVYCTFSTYYKLENIYLRAKGVAECFVYGDSLQNYCIAIVVPAKDYVIEQAKQLNIQGQFEDLCMNPQIIKLIKDNMITYGKSEKLNSLECVTYHFLIN